MRMKKLFTSITVMLLACAAVSPSSSLGRYPAS